MGDLNPPVWFEGRCVFYRKIMTVGRPTPSQWHTDSVVTDILPDSRKWEAGLSLLFFQRTRVGIPASVLGGSQLSVTLAPGGQVPSLASAGICSPLPLSYPQIFKYAALLPIRTMWRSLRTEKKQLRYMCSKLQNKSKEQHKEIKSVRTDWTLYRRLQWQDGLPEDLRGGSSLSSELYK